VHSLEYMRISTGNAPPTEEEKIAAPPVVNPLVRVHPKTGRVTIEGVNVVKRHRRATQTTESGIVEFPAPIHHSKAMLIDPKSGEPSRIRRRRDADGTVERIAVKSDQSIARNR